MKRVSLLFFLFVFFGSCEPIPQTEIPIPPTSAPTPSPECELPMDFQIDCSIYVKEWEGWLIIEDEENPNWITIGPGKLYNGEVVIHNAQEVFERLKYFFSCNPKIDCDGKIIPTANIFAIFFGEYDPNYSYRFSLDDLKAYFDDGTINPYPTKFEGETFSIPEPLTDMCTDIWEFNIDEDEFLSHSYQTYIENNNQGKNTDNFDLEDFFIKWQNEYRYLVDKDSIPSGVYFVCMDDNYAYPRGKCKGAGQWYEDIEKNELFQCDNYATIRFFPGQIVDQLWSEYLSCYTRYIFDDTGQGLTPQEQFRNYWETKLGDPDDVFAYYEDYSGKRYPPDQSKEYNICIDDFMRD